MKKDVLRYILGSANFILLITNSLSHRYDVAIINAAAAIILFMD